MNKVLKLLRSVRYHGKDGVKAYVVKWKITDTKEQVIPHSRPRWYCVGIRKDASKADSFAFPGCLDCPAIETLSDDEGNSSQFHNPFIQVSNTMQANINSAKQRIKESGGNLDQPYVVDCNASRQKSNPLYDIPPCIATSRNRGHWLIHKNRRMNVKEMMRLHGIDPDNFNQVVSDSVMGQQLGNAMSVNVVERIIVNSLGAAGLVRKSCLKTSKINFLDGRQEKV